MSNNGRSRNTGANPTGTQWCYTLNNYTDDDVLRLRALHTHEANKVVFHTFQAEVGEGGTPHLQGYVAFENKKLLRTVKKLISERAHLERTLGTPQQAAEYCNKEESRDHDNLDIVHCFGDVATVPDLSVRAAASSQAKRNDLIDVKRKIDAGEELWAISEDEAHFSSVLRHYKGFQAYKHARTAPRDHKTLVLVFYGAPGTGKSRAAFNFDSAFVVPASNGTQWMDGYDPARHRTVIFDDFHASVPAHLLLRLLDNYPLQFPTKGGFVQFRPDAVVLTSNYHPKEWYKWNEIKADYSAFERRVDIQWHYFQPETQADKDWCEQNDIHCLLVSDKGDWHPQLAEFVEHGNDGKGRKVLGVPKDALPDTINLEDQFAAFDSLMQPMRDLSESESAEIVIVESSSSPSQSNSSSN